MSFDVIITCSGLGTRLAPLTNYLNKAMIKLGDQPAISHIINSYPEGTRFIITLGYLDEQIKDYLDIAHSGKHIECVWVDKFEGEGSSLLYSLSKTFDLINKPFVYNACDTIVQNIPLSFEKENYAFSAKAMFDNQYRYYGLTIEDRPACLGEDCYIGLCYINDVDFFKILADGLLQDGASNLSDAHVLEQMSVTKRFISENDWTDIGNHASLIKAKSKFGHKIVVLEKENEETYYDDGKIVKYFSKKEKVDKLYKRYLELQDVAPVTHHKNNFLYYDFVKGDTFSKVLNEDSFLDFLSWCKYQLWVQLDDINYRASTNIADFHQFFYENKAKERVQKYLARFPNSKNITSINFRKVDDIDLLLDKMSNLNLGRKLGCELCRTHGDLVFENVIKTDSYVMIDWREEFYEPYGNSGDLYYDLAKMKHNLMFNHEVINSKQFIVNEENNQVIFDPGIPFINYELVKVLDIWCEENDFNLETINFKMALIQLSSSGLHLHDDAKLLFYMGWYNLQKMVNKYAQSS